MQVLTVQANRQSQSLALCYIPQVKINRSLTNIIISGFRVTIPNIFGLTKWRSLSNYPKTKNLEDKIRRIIQKYFSNSPILAPKAFKIPIIWVRSKIETNSATTPC
jgi:hypothetical protein